MASSAFHQAVVTLQSRGYFSNSGLNQENGIGSFRLISKGVKLDISLTTRGTCGLKRRIVASSQASVSNTSTVSDPVLSPSSGTSSESKKKSSNAIYLQAGKTTNFVWFFLKWFSNTLLFQMKLH